MSLTKEYIDEVMDNLAFFKNSKRPCQINLASGQELIHNISQINKKRGQLQMTNLGGVHGYYITSAVNIVSIESRGFVDRDVPPEGKVAIKVSEQPPYPTPSADYFEVCKAAGLAEQSIRVTTVTGRQYAGQVAGLNRWSVGLDKLDDMEGKVEVFFDWVTSIEVVG
ncbi:TPA: hypothetical protein ACXP8A_004975 [Klebsiella pneumoniae]|uniref:hypothetical protein n=1 Tax=Klebsiella TaxID=570 RepID=UPI000DE6E814|nr:MULTISPECIES: hypothetical protein [Klebsiella]HDH1444544.1 hypothetical protein [Klebsiella quasipneumoniae subsp. similipneumoniae]MDK1925403.1 hypothetical protein [Klebsiella sp. K4-41]SSG19139.1 Repressor of phase-1 flagellin [Klebsiella quasipneumoniae]SSH50486.1 Repressor of phase-1 flagellin [Klebsiella quasipneumoniae]SYO79835.1 Repressor of phase-1 flagellin [Klebsiella pneumoniae]